MGRNVNKTNTQQIMNAIAGTDLIANDLVTLTGNGKVYRTSRSGAAVLDNINVADANLPVLTARGLPLANNPAVVNRLELDDYFVERRTNANANDTIGVYGYDGTVRGMIIGTRNSNDSCLEAISATKFVDGAEGKIYDWSTQSAFSSPTSLALTLDNAARSVAALPNGNFVIAGTSNDGNYIVRFYVCSPAGAIVIGPITAYTTPGGTVDQVEVIARTDNGFAIMYHVAGAYPWRLKQFDASGNIIGSEYVKPVNTQSNPAQTNACSYKRLLLTPTHIAVFSVNANTNSTVYVDFLSLVDNTLASSITLTQESPYDAFDSVFFKNMNCAWIFHRNTSSNNKIRATQIDLINRKILKQVFLFTQYAYGDARLLYVLQDYGFVVVTVAGTAIYLELFTEGGAKLGLTVAPFTGSGSAIAIRGNACSNGKQIAFRVLDSGDLARCDVFVYSITRASVLGVVLKATNKDAPVPIARVGTYTVNNYFAGAVVTAKDNTIPGTNAQISGNQVVLTR